MKLSDNYYSRKCYLARDQVPSQSVIKNTMFPSLAKVYFKSMSPHLKVLAGLEPPLKGGGDNWYVPPEKLLAGKVVLTTQKKENLAKLGFDGIAEIGTKIADNFKRSLKKEEDYVCLESDKKWKIAIEAELSELWDKCAKNAADLHSQKLMSAYMQFSVLYTDSISLLQRLMLGAAEKEVKSVRVAAIKKMQHRYRNLKKRQATEIYDIFPERLTKEKARLKAKFIENLEETQTELGNQLHEINYEKHLAIEKLRHLLECQNLACQVYVAMKEREEGQKEIDMSKHTHMKKVKKLTEEIVLKDFEISLAKEKEKKRQEFNKIWQQKVCEVVKKFQIFLTYVLRSIPEQSEFFLNMEKLMMLQLNEALDNPTAESIFKPESELHAPVPRPHPFFLFWDKSDYNMNLDQNLCPKDCTSSASQFPVIIVNKRGIYAACDNFEKFTDKVTQYINGRCEDDKDFEDDVDDSKLLPIKYNSSQQLQELKLESSLLQIIQSEMPNTSKVPTECNICTIPYCFCSPVLHSCAEEIGSKKPIASKKSTSLRPPSHLNSKMHVSKANLDTYAEYVKPKSCNCHKMAKKHLEEHLPPYMKQKSPFDFDLPNYEPCSAAELKKLLGRGKRIPRAPIASRMRDACTQYIEPEFDQLCTCFSEEEIEKFLLSRGMTTTINDITGSKNHDLFTTETNTPPYLGQSTSVSSFAIKRAASLRKLIHQAPELADIFGAKDCNY